MPVTQAAHQNKERCRHCALHLFLYYGAMKEQLTVSLLQTELAWEDPSANFGYLDRMLQRLQPGQTDLLILPEMFTTGFSMNAAQLAEPTKGQAYQWMAEKAAYLQAVVTGSIIAEVDGQYFNRLLWVHPDGTFSHYDKRHLFTLAGEEKVYQPGQTHLLTELKGWTIMPLICYDLRFPVWSRNTMGYDLLIYVANWPSKRRNAWKSLLVARAIENQAYTIGVNRVGEDGNGYPHAGDTSILDYAGEPLLQAADVESVFTVSLDPEKQDEFRRKLRFLDDRDAFELR